MAQGGQRKCLCCGTFFFPDHRNVGRQRYCSAVDCRRASKAGSQAAWLAQPGNADYFKSPVHVQRVRQWRSQHPGYSRGRQRPAVALQDPCHAQVVDPAEQTPVCTEPAAPVAAVALQDPLLPTQALLTGLIAHLFELTLQDDMAATTRRLVQLGQDLLQGGPGHEDDQAGAAGGPAAPGARAVQLG